MITQGPRINDALAETFDLRSSSRKGKTIQLAESTTSVKVSEKDVAKKNFGGSDYNLSTDPKKRKEDTHCSTQGASTCNSQVKVKNKDKNKVSFFCPVSRLPSENAASAELKHSYRRAGDPDPINNVSMQRLFPLVEARKASSKSDSDSCSGSECSGVELSLENSPVSSSVNSIQVPINKKNASWRNKNDQKGNLNLDEPLFSDSSSCDFSFEYLREDKTAECQLEHFSISNNVESHQLLENRSLHSIHVTMRTGSRRQDSPDYLQGKQRIVWPRCAMVDFLASISTPNLSLVFKNDSTRPSQSLQPLQNLRKCRTFDER
jgi:hypothetical protein